MHYCFRTEGKKESDYRVKVKCCNNAIKLKLNVMFASQIHSDQIWFLHQPMFYLFMKEILLSILVKRNFLVNFLKPIYEVFFSIHFITKL